MRLSREIKTAILVISAILLFIWGYSFLKGKDLFNSYKYFYVVYDNVEGLSTSAPVTLNGLNVGKVNEIKIASDARLIVEVQVKSDFPISKTSALQIYEPGFIGGKQIAIIPNLDDHNLAKSGDTLTSNIRVGLLAKLGSQVEPLQEKVESTVVSADSLLTNFNTLLNQKNKDNLAIAIAELAQTMKSFNKMLNSNQNNIDGIMSNLNHTSANFSRISDSLAQMNLGQTVKKLENTLANVNSLISDIESGKGTFGKLMKDEAMYNNLTNASKELELLLQDIRLNPTRYINISVFGKKNKPYVAPKENK